MSDTGTRTPNPDDDRAKRPDRFALIAALVTAVLSFTPLADMRGSVFILGACVFWTGFVVVRVYQDRTVLRKWGFRGDNIVAASSAPLVVFLLGVAALAGYAWHTDALRFPAHTLLLFPVYAVWGMTQQLLTLGIFARNLERFDGFRRRTPLLILSVAMLFGLIHANNLKLAMATFLLELVIVPMYLRHRNLWPLGLLHGCLGGLFYLWVEGRDLWAERFG